MVDSWSTSESADYGASLEELSGAAVARPHAGVPPVEANSLRQREELSGAAVARSETGGPPVERNSGPRGGWPVPGGSEQEIAVGRPVLWRALNIRITQGVHSVSERITRSCTSGRSIWQPCGCAGDGRGEC